MKSVKNTFATPVIMTMLIGIALSVTSPAMRAEEKYVLDGTPLPASMIGTWQVTEVHVDRGATRTLFYRINDPRLAGRIFSIGPDKLETNTPEEKRCMSLNVARKIPNVAKLIQSSMAGRSAAPEKPTLHDYRLSIPNVTVAEAFTVNCGTTLWAGGLGREGSVNGAWIVALPSNKIVVRWYDETILVLDRIPDNTKPNASYRCAEASSPVEKTICASIALAAFDRSVADAYASTAKQLKATNNPTVLDELRAQQKTWLNRRDSCGADDRCLEKSMSDRLEEIEVLSRQG